MDISFWKYLLPHGKLAALRQPIPEVAVFGGTEIEACYCSGLQGSPQYQSSTAVSRDLLLDRFLALAAFATGQHSFSGRSPAAILRQPCAPASGMRDASIAHSISKYPGLRSEVLSVAQLRLLLASPEKHSSSYTTSAQWSLQALVAPAQDLMIVAEYLCDSFGTEHIDVTGSSYQATYTLCGENGIRFMHTREASPCESTEEVPEHQSREARANLLALVLHASSILQCCIKHIRVEFLVDRSGRMILHAFLDVALFEKGYPLYPPKSVASRCDGATHCVYSLWPSDIPTPTRSCQLAPWTNDLSLSLCSPRHEPQSAHPSMSEIEPDESIEATVLQNESNVLSDAEQLSHDTACLKASGEAVSTSGPRVRKLKKGRQASHLRTLRRPVKPPALPPSMPPLPIANPPAHGSLSARLQMERHSFHQHVDHTLCLPASTCLKALSARARLESEPIVRPQVDNAALLGRDIGVLEAMPAPITLQRPGVAPLEREPEAQYPLPQDDKARCIICTLPIPCQHTDAQREAFARHTALPRAVPPASKPLALLDHKAAPTKACKSGKCRPLAPLSHMPCDPGSKDAKEPRSRSHSAHALLTTTWVVSIPQAKKTNVSCRPTLANLVGRTSLNEKQK